MAAKKAAAASSGKKGKLARREKEPQKKLLGKRVMYIGMGGKRTVCVCCGRSKIKGMISILDGQSYCSEACVVRTR